MTPKQANLFVRVCQTGIACGLEHRYEWYNNYDSMLYHGPWTELGVAREALWDTILAFEKGTASCPEEEEELAKMTLSDLSEKINRWYNRDKG
jgi:hypothetical protein